MYNAYVKNIFSETDGLYCKKLQFIPKAKMENLMESHFANRLFDKPEDAVKRISTIDKDTNNEWKKTKFDAKPLILNLIIALTITMIMVVGLVMLGAKYIFILICIMLYVLDLVITCIYSFKVKFDDRFLK